MALPIVTGLALWLFLGVIEALIPVNRQGWPYFQKPDPIPPPPKPPRHWKDATEGETENS